MAVDGPAQNLKVLKCSIDFWNQIHVLVERIKYDWTFMLTRYLKIFYLLEIFNSLLYIFQNQ